MAVPKEIVRDVREYIEEQGISWAKEYIAGRKNYLASRGIKASGELLNELSFEVISRLDEALQSRIELAFSLHGRFIDMKKIRSPKGGSSYIDELEAWVRLKGFDKKWTTGFVKKRKLKSVPLNIANQMAWGIAINKGRNTRRRRGWYAKSSNAAINDLYNNIAAGLPDQVLQAIKSSFNQ